MRVLVTTTAGVGHLFPLVPLAWACERAGHEVRVAAPESFADAVARVGLTHHPLPDLEARHWERLDRVFAEVMRRKPVGTRPTPETEGPVLRDFFGWAKTDSTLPAMRALIASWRPDVVLNEAAELTGPIAAEEAGVRHVTVAMGLRHTLDRWLPYAAEGADEVATAIGLPPDPQARRLLAAPYVTCAAASLEDPAALTPANTWRYRPVDLHPAEAPVLPPGDGPLVWITFGTEAARIPGALDYVLPPAIEAAGMLPRVRFLLTVGNDAPVLPSVPSNVEVRSYIPQEQVLAACDAVVFHGGFNTTVASLRHGRPCLVVPLFSTDQFETADRLDATGAGRLIEQPVASNLRDGIEALLSDGRYREVAEELAAELAALPLADDLVEVLTASGRALQPDA